MDSGLIYANARIKSLENNLLTIDKILRMVDAISLEEAVKVLTENNYGGGIVLDNPNKFDSLLRSETRNVIEFIREIMPKGHGLEVFFLKMDYHNVKALVKARLSGLNEYDVMLMNNGLINLEILVNGVTGGDYSVLHPEMAEALKEIDEVSASFTISPRAIDIALDKAYYKHAVRATAKGADSIRKYVTASADLNNISAFIRCRRAGLSIKDYESGYVTGGTLPLEMFTQLYEQSDEAISEKFRYNQYKDIANKALDNKHTSLVDYEVALDNYLLNIFKNDKHDMFSIAPMAGYYLAKMTEIKVARMVLVCLKNKVDRLIIKQRLRELYA